MRIRKTLVASAVFLALGFTSPAWAQSADEAGNGDLDQDIDDSYNDESTTLDLALDLDASQTDDHSGDDRNNDGEANADGLGNAAANNHSNATANWESSFNTNIAIASTELTSQSSTGL